MYVQAFPDFHVFVGLGVGTKYGSGKGVRTVSERYLQVGLTCHMPALWTLATAVEAGITSSGGRLAPQVPFYHTMFVKEHVLGPVHSAL